MLDLLVYCLKYWPRETIPPNLHMLEDHAANFIERSLSGHGVYGDHGAKSIHKILRLMQRTYCSMQPATIRLQSMLKKEHYRLVDPAAKALKLAILKRK